MAGRKLVALDTSALFRLTDKSTEFRVRVEAAGMHEVIRLLDGGFQRFLMTWPLIREIYYAPEARLWAATFQMLPDASIYITLSDEVRRKAMLLAGNGVKGMDALHVACAVVGGADVLFTADDDMLKFGATAGRLIEGLRIASPKDFREALA